MINILLVEDNPADAYLTTEILEMGDTSFTVTVVADGMKAMDHLYAAMKAVSSPTPDVVLLDLNIPRKHGREVLAEMKRDEALKSIPVVVLTSSDADRDILECYTLGANCYIRKPGDLHGFEKAIRSFEEFWCSIATLPTRTEVPR